MPADMFQIAAMRAALSKPGEWHRLTVTEQCHIIYDELRKLDEEHLVRLTAKRLETQARGNPSPAVGIQRQL